MPTQNANTNHTNSSTSGRGNPHIPDPRGPHHSPKTTRHTPQIDRFSLSCFFMDLRCGAGDKEAPSRLSRRENMTFQFVTSITVRDSKRKGDVSNCRFYKQLCFLDAWVNKKLFPAIERSIASNCVKPRQMLKKTEMNRKCGC